MFNDQMDNISKKIVITGGHHSSALPVIERLRSIDRNIEIIWFGHKYSLRGDKSPTLEFIEISGMDIPFINLNAGKVYRNFNIFKLFKVPFGFFRAFFSLFRLKPNVILSFGGYLAVPVVISGWLLGIPVVTHEQTVVVGYANKLISFFAKKILISWPTSEKHFPKEKIMYSGIPLRKEILISKSNAITVENNLPVVYVMGGKTGSHLINNLILNNMEKILTVCNVIHQTGNNSVYGDYERLVNKYEEIRSIVKGSYYARKFILEGEIGEIYSKANLVISRSGAHVTAELLALEKPSLLIPIPWVSHNEQYENAKILKNAGLSEILEEKDLLKKDFSEYIKQTLTNINKYKLNDLSIKNLIKQNAAEVICKEVLKLMK